MKPRGAPFKKGNKLAKGGVRKGAGAKLSPFSVLSRLAIAELDEEAEKSIRFMVDVRDDVFHPIQVRVHCAENLIDRRFGKPKQVSEIEGALKLSSDELVQILKKERSERGIPEN